MYVGDGGILVMMMMMMPMPMPMRKMPCLLIEMLRREKMVMLRFRWVVVVYHDHGMKQHSFSEDDIWIKTVLYDGVATVVVVVS